MTEPIRLSRRGFLGATMAAAAPRASPSPAPRRSRAAPSAKTSPLVVHDWAYYQKDFTGFKAYFQKYGVPKYITFNTDQAELAARRLGRDHLRHHAPLHRLHPGLAGRRPDRPDRHDEVHGLAARSTRSSPQPGIVDGKTYGIPWDWGYSAPMYRADKYTPSSQSWEAVLFDKKLRGKVTMYDEGVAIIKIGALINGHQNVNTLTQKQINQSRDTMIKAKANIVSFWQSETQAMQDFISGKVWVTYAWPDTYAQVVAKPA